MTFDELVSVDELELEAAEVELLKRKIQTALRQAYLKTGEAILDVEGEINKMLREVKERRSLDVQALLERRARLRTLKEVESDTLSVWGDLFPDETI
jgi:hypothetical protein